VTATPPRADLRTLAAEAIRQLRGPHGPLEDGSFWTKMGSDDELADAVLAAVLPEHRRMVLAEAADELTSEIEWQREKYGDGSSKVAMGRLIGLEDARATLRRLAAAAPETTASAPVPAEPAPAVPEVTPGGFHEPDEPTDHIQAVFDAGTHGRTAPPRGQTRRLDVTAGLAAAERDVVVDPPMDDLDEPGRRAAAAEGAIDCIGERHTIPWEQIRESVADVQPLIAELRSVRAEVERSRAGWATVLDELNRTGEILLRTRADRDRLGAQVAHYRRVVEAAKALVAAIAGATEEADWDEEPFPTRLHELAAAVDALPDAPLGSPSTGTSAPKGAPKDADPTVAKSIAQEAAGWVPLADVLDAVWDIDAIQRWASRSGVPLGSFIGHQQIRDYLAERFPTAPGGWEPTFFERRAARDPSIDHSSHSMQWVGRCPECPSDTAPEGADERNGHG
jgi:hypothetical protein